MRVLRLIDVTTADTVLPTLSAAETRMPIRPGDIERGTVAISRPPRRVGLERDERPVASCADLDRPARDARQRVRHDGGDRPPAHRHALDRPAACRRRRPMRSIRVTLLAASSAMVVTVWRPSATPLRSYGFGDGDGARRGGGGSHTLKRSSDALHAVDEHAHELMPALSVADAASGSAGPPAAALGQAPRDGRGDRVLDGHAAPPEVRDRRWLRRVRCR